MNNLSVAANRVFQVRRRTTHRSTEPWLHQHLARGTAPAGDSRNWVAAGCNGYGNLEDAVAASPAPQNDVTKNCRPGSCRRNGARQCHGRESGNLAQRRNAIAFARLFFVPQSKYNGRRQINRGGNSRRSPWFWAALTSGALSLPAHAQDAMKKEAPIKKLSPSQAVLEQWNDIGRKLIAMAEDFPEDKYDFKPTPAQRSFAEQLLHAANGTYFFTNVANGQKPPAEEDPKRDQYKTRADVVAFVKKSFADGAAAIKAKGDKGMSDLVVEPFSHEQMRIVDLARPD